MLDVVAFSSLMMSTSLGVILVTAGSSLTFILAMRRFTICLALFRINTSPYPFPVKELGRIWKYSLGSFSDDKTEPYDNFIAAIRTVLFVSYLVTNCFIVAGVIRHWNDVPLNNSTTSSLHYGNSKRNA